MAEEHLRQSQPLEIRTAVLHYKVTSSYTPDFWSRNVKKWRWLIYPWAVIEDIKEFAEQMEYRPTTLEGLKERLTQDYRIKVSEQVLEDVRHLLDEG